jgi:hypothetical protein
MENQQTIDFTALEQVALLRDLELPARLGVSSVAVKSVLSKIVFFAKRSGICFASQETIASETGASLRVVRRAIAALVKLSLITCDRESRGDGRKTLNHYSPVWSEISLLAGRGRKRDQVVEVRPFDLWSRVVAELSGVGVQAPGAVVEAAKRRGMTPDQVVEVVAVYRLNQSKFKSPGVVSWVVKNGFWPIEVETLEQQRERDRKRFVQVVEDMRARGMSDDEIRARAMAKEWSRVLVSEFFPVPVEVSGLVNFQEVH